MIRIPPHDRVAISRCSLLSNWLVRHLLPIGCLALLTGLFWSWDRSLYHKLYYALIAVPTLLAILLQPKQLREPLVHPLMWAVLAFAGYTLITLLWSNTDNSAGSLAKRPLYVLMLFLGLGLLALRESRRLIKVLKIAAVIAVLAGALSLGHHLYSHAGARDLGRMSGYGALFNPLLSAHVYGFFAAFWLAAWFSAPRAFSPKTILGLLLMLATLLATGSRTPLLALGVTLIWLASARCNRRSLIGIGSALLGTLSLLFFHPGSLTTRGLSYRPEIWEKSLRTVLEAPWFGHGFDHHFVVQLDAGLTLYDPHNLALAVLLSGGVVGLALWLTLHAIALAYAWRNRQDHLVLMASALVVFGFTAGLTEGRGFLSRPNEHWFLIWIPLALLFAAWVNTSATNRRRHAPAERA